MGTRFPAAIAVVLCAAAACRPAAREYELRGVVVAVDRGRQEITIKHEDIPRFMPGMTMPFKVREAGLLEGRTPGDVVRATLVVEDNDAHLREIVRTGSAPVPDDAPARLTDILEAGAVVPDAAFSDQDGRSRRLSDWRGRALAVTFIYTRCPVANFCPLMDHHYKTVQERIRQDASLRERAHLLSVSFDPAHDTPPVLAAHADRLGADRAIWNFVTGDAAEIQRFASSFGVSVLRQGAPGEEIVHNLATGVIDAEGRLAAIFRGNEWTPEELLAELRKAVGR
jgi:protein SCO1/2